MAKRGGGFGGGMIPGNMQNMLKQAQHMQSQLQESRAKLDEEEFTASAGGGAVSVTLTGAKKLKNIEISKDAVDPEDVETLQEMIMAAFNEAMKQVDEAGEKLFGGLPGGFGM